MKNYSLIQAIALIESPMDEEADDLLDAGRVVVRELKQLQKRDLRLIAFGEITSFQSSCYELVLRGLRILGLSTVGVNLRAAQGKTVRIYIEERH